LSSNPRRNTSQIRIIGGQYRSRRLKFAAADGLRPTPDRMRETLFNWLAPDIAGSKALDLFAGSGALGFEALSRGAANVTFVESNSIVQKSIQRNLDLLDAKGSLERQSAWRFLRDCEGQFDLIFVDPPYGKGASTQALEAIVEFSRLRENGMIYLEHRYSDQASRPPKNWSIYRSARCGEVMGYLISPTH
jgi:16S rRNA (guanine966-N2)-methyltransferase